MIVVVSGPRDYPLECRPQVFDVLTELFLKHRARWFRHNGSANNDDDFGASAMRASFILRHGVSGNVDTWANEWGLERKISIERFPAEWRDPVTGVYQPWAGPKRNKAMAVTEPQPDLWLAFWDGKFTKRGGKPVSGTYDGIVSALEAGVRVHIEPPRKQ